MPLPGQLEDADAAQDFQIPRRPAPVITSLAEVDIKLDRLAEKLDVCIKELSSMRQAQRPRDVDGMHLKAPDSGYAQTPRSQVSSIRATALADDARLPLSANVAKFVSTGDESDVESFPLAPMERAAPRGVQSTPSERPRRRNAGHSRGVDLQTAWQLHAKAIAGDSAGQNVQPMMRLIYRSTAENVWEFLDDPNSSRCAWWTWSVMRVLVLTSACTQYLQERQPTLALVCDTCFDTIFLIEFLSRLLSTPSKRTYLTDPLNWADMVSALGLPLRAITGFTTISFPPSDALEIVLVFLMPIVRLLKLLRYFESFRLLTKACVNSMEAVPFLSYMLSVMTLSSATVIYLVEPRDNIPSMPHSLWLALVTMTTVGYGDYFPVTFAGYVMVSVLTCVSVLFLAIPAPRRDMWMPLLRRVQLCRTFYNAAIHYASKQ